MLWAKNPQRSDIKGGPPLFKKSSSGVIFYLLLCTVGNAGMQPTPVAYFACEVARYYLPPREDYFRGGFFLLTFKF